MSERRFFGDALRMGLGVRGVLSAMAKETERLVKSRIEKRLQKLQLVRREEFEVVRTMAQQARTECCALEKRVCALEKASTSARKKKSPKTASKIS